MPVKTRKNGVDGFEVAYVTILNFVQKSQTTANYARCGIFFRNIKFRN